MTIKRKHLYIIVPICVAIFLLNDQIFGVLNGLLSRFSTKYDSAATATGAYDMLILFVIFAVFSYVIPGTQEIDREMIGLRNCLLVAVVLQCFAPVHTLAMRMNYYYIILIPVLIPKLIDLATLRYRLVARAACWIMNQFFASYFIMNIYQSAVTGYSALSTVPYIPFWGA